jgi:chromosome segregation ATPase
MFNDPLLKYVQEKELDKLKTKMSNNILKILNDDNIPLDLKYKAVNALCYNESQYLEQIKTLVNSNKKIESNLNNIIDNLNNKLQYYEKKINNLESKLNDLHDKQTNNPHIINNYYTNDDGEYIEKFSNSLSGDEKTNYDEYEKYEHKNNKQNKQPKKYKKNNRRRKKNNNKNRSQKIPLFI